MKIYPFKCILPYDRVIYLNNNYNNNYNDNNNFQQIQEQQQEQEEEPYNINITVISKNNEITSIKLLELGNYFQFHYSSYLQFLHETSLRNYIYWGLDEQSSLPQLDNELERKLLIGEVSNKIYIRHIGYINDIDIGYGVYASEKIQINEFIGEYTGVIMESTFVGSNSSYSLNYPTADKSYVIDASEFGSIIRFVNHSSNPNTEFRSILHQGIVHILCITIREIEKDEQVTVNYGQSYWHHRNINPIELS